MLCFVICAAALTYTDTGSTQTSPPQGRAAKVLGCVSASNGNYNLTDGSGTIYRLAGDASKFNEHNAHKVEVTGTVTPSTSDQAGSQPTLTVASIQPIAPNCNASQ
jgi:hypothetical protein